MSTMTELIDNTVRTKFHDLLNDQIANEFSASQQYIAVAVTTTASTCRSWPPLLPAGRRRAQPRDDDPAILPRPRHAHRLPGVDVPRSEFDNYKAPIDLALAQGSASPSRSSIWRAPPATTATTSASSSCSGSSRSRSRKWPP